MHISLRSKLLDFIIKPVVGGSPLRGNRAFGITFIVLKILCTYARNEFIAK